MSETIIEGEAREIVPVAKQADLVGWTPGFSKAIVDEAIERKNEKRRFFESVMVEGQHYGKIPGTGDDAKPTLLKPGAEMLLSNMQLNKVLTDAEPPIIDYTGELGGSGEPLIRFKKVCRIYRQIGLKEDERMLVAQSEGICSSREEKYRWRNDKRLCPECGKPAIIKGKAEYGGGWLCFKKKDGCGAKFQDGDVSIEGQVAGKILNPNIAEVENTISKMAEKRALVGATLLATGCSDIFTQDQEDAYEDVQEPTEAGAAHAPAPRRRAEAVGTSTAKPADKAEKFRFAHAPPQAVKNAEIIEEKMKPAEDPVAKGRAIEAVLDTKRRFPRGQWREFMIKTVGTVNDGELTIADLERLRIEAEEHIDSLREPEPPYAAELEDDVPL